MRQCPVKSIRSALSLLFLASAATAADVDEFRVKREAVFEFAQKPTVTREGDRVTITFETKGFCDVTVAIEEAGEKGVRRPDAKESAAFFAPKIVRHLASGVLGPNAPEPFQKGTKKQTIVWDGKDDQGVYVDDKGALAVRVSLGLKPQFERTLFWSPYKSAVPNSLALLKAAPEGVYIHEGQGVDHLRLFDHAGNYLRAIYPFPAAKLGEVKGLEWATFPQDGARLPLRPTYLRSTFLPTGTSADRGKTARGGRAGTAIAVWNNRIALAMNFLGRLSTDGASGGLPLKGAPVTFQGILGGYYNPTGLKFWPVPPRSAAFSPDGQWVYLTGYVWTRYQFLGPHNWGWLHGVARTPYADDGPVTVFVGSLTEKDSGTDNQHFRCPTSVAADAQGRVYVADYMNNRIQVYSAEGQHLKAIPVRKPAKIEIHPKTGELYVFSWALGNWWCQEMQEEAPPLEPRFTRIGGFDNPKTLASFPLAIQGHSLGGWALHHTGGLIADATVDVWADPVTVWIAPGIGQPIQLLVERDGRLEVKRDFAKDIARTIVRAQPPVLQRQRLYVNPVDGMLYVAESDCSDGKGFNQLVAINPSTGRARLLDLPMASEDLAIGVDGVFYLRSDLEVARFDPATWKEIPWDYGEERRSAGFGGARARMTSLVAGLPLPSAGRPSWWHMGGMAVNTRGHVAVTCYNPTKDLDRRAANEEKLFYERSMPKMKAYTPTLYPGRVRFGEIHVWDERGRVLHKDAFPGLAVADGLGLDQDDNLYVLANPNRMLDGEPYFIGTGETLIKTRPGTKVVSTSEGAPVPLPKTSAPERPPDLVGGAGLPNAWIDDAEWFYGGVGFGARDCICWNARFALDLFARSFAPEVDHFSVAVLDTNGNVVTRVGQYGNVEDGKPLVAAGGPAAPRSIGGDEVALCYAPYVGTHTDRRLFIADAGNARILSVRLGYHAEDRIALRDVPEAAARK